MELAEVVGQLAGLRRFPVVGLAGEAPNEVVVRPEGAVGDRVFEVIEESSGRALSFREAPELSAFAARFLDDLVVDDLESWIRIKTPDGREFPLTDPEWLSELSRRLGRAVRWRRVAESAPDHGILHLISRPTLRFVERVYGTTLEPRFLRANFLIDLSEGKAFEEDEWVGRQIRIGDALCEILAPSQNCLAVTDRLEKPAGDLSMVAGLLKVRGGSLGLRARATKGQRIRVSDPVSLVD